MYEIYKTESIIIRKRESRENDANVLIFSRDFGLIWVAAIGIRRENSKTKAILQELSYANIFLVKGKTGYRVTGGEEITNFSFIETNFKREKNKAIKNSLSLLEQLLIKNHKDTKAFDLINNFAYELIDLDDSSKCIKKKEIKFLISFLNHFGYFNNESIQDIEIENLEEQGVKKIIFEINSQLKKIAF